MDQHQPVSQQQSHAAPTAPESKLVQHHHAQFLYAQYGQNSRPLDIELQILGRLLDILTSGDGQGALELVALRVSQLNLVKQCGDWVLPKKILSKGPINEDQFASFVAQELLTTQQFAAYKSTKRSTVTTTGVYQVKPYRKYTRSKPNWHKKKGRAKTRNPGR